MEANLISPVSHVENTNTCCYCPITEHDLVWENERALCCCSWPWKQTNDKWFIDQHGRIQIRRDVGPPLSLCCLTWSCSIITTFVTAMICGGSGASACSGPVFSSIIIEKDSVDGKVYMQFQRKDMCCAKTFPRKQVISAEVLSFRGRGKCFAQTDLYHVIIKGENNDSYYSLAEEGGTGEGTGGGGREELMALAAAINNLVQGQRMQHSGGREDSGVGLTTNILRS